jgi:hypothetical protein
VTSAKAFTNLKESRTDLRDVVISPDETMHNLWGVTHGLRDPAHDLRGAPAGLR